MLDLPPFFHTRNGEPYRQTIVTPLVSWDIHGMNYRRSLLLEQDTLQLNNLAEMHKWHRNWNYKDLLYEGKTILVTDVTSKIAFASHNIYEMSGYLSHELVGKKPSTLQGRDTDEETLKLIRNAIKERQAFEAKIINYKKDGEPYLCHIEAFPLFDRKNELRNYLAIEESV